jgi:hypothetical protein
LKVGNQVLLLENQVLNHTEKIPLHLRVGKTEVFGLIILAGCCMEQIIQDLQQCFTVRQSFYEHRAELEYLQEHKLSAIAPREGEQRPLLSVSLLPFLSNSNTETSSPVALVRFAFPSMTYAYEFMYELFQPLAIHQLDGLQLFHDRIVSKATSTVTLSATAMQTNAEIDTAPNYDAVKENSNQDPYCVISKIRRYRQQIHNTTS